MKQIIRNITIMLFIVGFVGTACENTDIEIDGGVFPETGGVDKSAGLLRSDNYAMTDPLIDMDHQDLNDALHIELSLPTTENGTYTVSVDEAQVAVFNAKHGVNLNYLPFPTDLVTLENGGQLTVEKGKLQSNSIPVTFKFDNSLTEEKMYLLPLSVVANSGSPLDETRSTLYYRINVWGEVPAEYNATGKNYIQIAGIDPELTNPLLINKLYLIADSPVAYFNPFDIVNLQFATVRVDENNLPYLYLKEDLAYVLSNRLKYIAPLQKLDHQVCLAIKGGSEGLGFSNLSEFQMKMFIYRIKEMIDLYKLDGVNLHDIGFGIDKSETSNDLAKGLGVFVSQLRNELSDKIITYTQTAESPEGITSDDAGIKLGELVDYAWTDQSNKIINPWDHPDQWWAKPIAGITKKRWGALNSDIHGKNEDIDILNQEVIDNLTLINEDINHVFVIKRVEDVTIQTDGDPKSYLVWGAESNLWDDYGSLSIPGGYGSIYNPLAPKDY